MRFPLLVGLAAIVLLIAAVFGLMRIKVDDSLSQLFRSDTPEFKTFEEVTRRFPSNEFDVLIVVEGKNLLERASIEKLRDLVTDLQLIDGARGIISMFSARQPPQGNELPAPLFPEQLPQGAEYDQLVQRVMSNEVIRGKLLSEDGELTLIVLALDPDVVATSRLREVIGEIQKTIHDDLAGTQLTARLSGVPVMQLEMRNALERDRLFYNAFGFAAGCLIAIVFFRRLSFMIIGAGPPLLAIVLSLGALGWLDFGENKYDAFRNAMLVVGPACLLTHATAALSFIALQFSESDLIRTFGEAGFVATLIAMIAVLMLVPLLGVLLVRDESTFAAEVRRADSAVNVCSVVFAPGLRPEW